MTILFAGIPSEPPLALAIESALALDIAFVIFNQLHSDFNDIAIDLGDDGPKGVVQVAGQRFALDDFTGIYARLVDVNTIPPLHARDVHDPARTIERATLTTSLLSEWLEIAPCRVVNRPSMMASNGSKPYQAQLITRSGFLTPPTLITNDPSAVRDFCEQHERVVYKSISAVRSIVRELDASAMERISSIEQLPTQFQAYVPGTDFRVHVVGDAVFASKISSVALDYRYAYRDDAGLEMSPAELPADVEDRCRTLARALGLAFAGIDLKVTPDGQWFCFEVNPSPAYSFFQAEAGQPISDALVRYLSGG